MGSTSGKVPRNWQSTWPKNNHPPVFKIWVIFTLFSFALEELLLWRLWPWKILVSIPASYKKVFILFNIVFTVTALFGFKKLISNLVLLFLISFIARKCMCNTSTGYIFVSVRYHFKIKGFKCIPGLLFFNTDGKAICIVSLSFIIYTLT